MRRSQLRNPALLFAALPLCVAVYGCGSDNGSDQLASGQNDPNGTGVGNGTGPGGTTKAPPTPEEEVKKFLDQRKLDYGEALRTASLKLVGALPTMEQIQKISAGDDNAKKAVYEAEIDKMMADPRFTDRMVIWWKDTFATGGAPQGQKPSYDTAANFAAQITIEDRPYTDLFTAKTGTCPTYDGNAKTFTAANCPGTQPVAGVISDPGLMSQYYANMAFRRVRMIQEKFVCTKFPSEYSTTPKAMGPGTYTSPWPFESVTGGASSKVNFQDTSAVICANCHTTMNHIAPLFGFFDQNGAYNAAQIQVQTPVPGNPRTTLADWLPPGQQTYAWRNGKPVADLVGLGAEIAKDPDVARCAVTRVYNWAMSKGDVVNDIAGVPAVVTDPHLKVFKDKGLKLKPVIRSVFTAEDFVKF